MLVVAWDADQIQLSKWVAQKDQARLHTLCWFCVTKKDPEPINSLVYLMRDAVYFTVFKDVFQAESQFYIQLIFKLLTI